MHDLFLGTSSDQIFHPAVSLMCGRVGGVGPSLFSLNNNILQTDSFCFCFMVINNTFFCKKKKKFA